MTKFCEPISFEYFTLVEFKKFDLNMQYFLLGFNYRIFYLYLELFFKAISEIFLLFC